MCRGNFEQIDYPPFLFYSIWRYLITGHYDAICYEKLRKLKKVVVPLGLSVSEIYFRAVS